MSGQINLVIHTLTQFTPQCTSFALGLAILSAIGLISYRTTQELITTSYWENHTYQVLGLLDELSSKFKDAETGQRGYIITIDAYKSWQTFVASVENILREFGKNYVINFV